MHHPVLEVPVLPERGNVCGVVRVPMMVLRAGQGVQVDNREDAVAPERLDGPVKVAEAIGLDLERSRVVLEMLVANGDSCKVQPDLAEERRVGLIEEPGEETLEETLGPVVADRAPHLTPHQRLVRRISGDEVLHVQPTTQADAAKEQRLAVRGEE